MRKFDFGDEWFVGAAQDPEVRQRWIRNLVFLRNLFFVLFVFVLIWFIASRLLPGVGVPEWRDPTAWLIPYLILAGYCKGLQKILRSVKGLSLGQTDRSEKTVQDSGNRQQRIRDLTRSRNWYIGITLVAVLWFLVRLFLTGQENTEIIAILLSILLFIGLFTDNELKLLKTADSFEAKQSSGVEMRMG